MRGRGCGLTNCAHEKYKSEWHKLLKQVAIGSDIRDPYQPASMLVTTCLRLIRLCHPLSNTEQDVLLGIFLKC